MNTPNGKNPLSYLGVTAPQPPNWVTGSTAPSSTLRFPGPTLYIDSSTDSVYATEGDGVFVTLGVGSSGDVVAVNGTANQITASTVAGVVTLSLPAAITAPGSLTTTTSLAATTTVTGGTGVTATTGNITATAGNVSAGAAVSATTTVTAGTDLVSTAGNVLIQGAGKQLRVEGGAVTDFIGQATLALGTVTVLNTNIAAGDKIFVSRQGINGSTALGVFDVAITPATSFSITALNPTDATTQTNDTSIVDYFIVRQL